MWALAIGVTMFVAPGPLGHDRYSRPTGRERVSLGHVSRTLLVAHEDVSDRRVDERVVDRQDRAAGQAEHHVDALALEALDQGLGSGEFHD